MLAGDQLAPHAGVTRSDDGLSPEAAQDDAAEVDKALEAALEDGSYWVEQRQVAAFLLGTIARCAVASPLRWLPHEIVQRIAQMAFRPRHHVRIELPDRRMPPAVREAFLARGGQCLVFPCAPTYFANWEDSLLAEWGPEEIPYPSIRLPAAGHVLYFELMLDDAWADSKIHVHHAAFVFGEDERPRIFSDTPRIIPDEIGDWPGGTVVQAWQDCWRNIVCSSWPQLSSVEERLMPWRQEQNYAVNRSYWRHVTTGQTTWEPPLASPPDWRSLCPCKCTAGCARVTLGLLVDLSAGFVTFRLNGVNGPRVPLGEGWQDGVEVRLGGSWPEPEAYSWQTAIEQPLCVPAGLYASPLLGPEWEPEEDSQDENSDGGDN